ncbi:MAG: 3-deoxy-7-phosphoheptulonate synthase [Deltaproteobacteria bacterium]|nr:3-deoxy-7-phosphoheptulonate synthase [Deltaproteobacteria bacterium]MBI3075865.1 3-deoxy-7-phosphoheptulonate synthase [Deltaproteobacteria bacterium]
MVIVLKPTATQEDIDRVVRRLQELGLQAHISTGKERTLIGAIGAGAYEHHEALEGLSGVDRVMPIGQPFKLVSREFRPEDTQIRVGDVVIGGKAVHVVAGPCSVESRERLFEVAQAVKRSGASILRGGAFKPRTSPYTFQGLGKEGLELLAEARELTGLPVVTELMDPRDTELVCEYSDVIQIGARNMQNFNLLKEVGAVRKPVLLKRGMSATIQEFLLSAEYIVSRGNRAVILCERGIRTFETATRNTLDLSAVPVIKQLSHLPVIVDPSHGTGKWDLVAPLAKAGLAVGADGLMIEVHAKPEEALSDGPQSLKPYRFDALMKELQAVAASVGRSL